MGAHNNVDTIDQLLDGCGSAFGGGSLLGASSAEVHEEFFSTVHV